MTEIIEPKIPSFDKKAYSIDYNKKYYKEHRNYWFEYHDCPCGSRFNMSHKSRHLATIKHKQYLENKDQIDKIKKFKLNSLNST